MKKKKKRRKNDGVDVLVAVTAYVFARHLWPPRIDTKKKKTGGPCMYYTSACKLNKREREALRWLFAGDIHTHMF
jgi:ribosomal protein S7